MSLALPYEGAVWKILLDEQVAYCTVKQNYHPNLYDGPKVGFALSQFSWDVQPGDLFETEIMTKPDPNGGPDLGEFSTLRKRETSMTPDQLNEGLDKLGLRMT
jgi:hypothetical protein